MAGTLPRDWYTETRVLVGATGQQQADAEVLAGDLLADCLFEGSARRAAPGRTRLLLLVDDVAIDGGAAGSSSSSSSFSSSEDSGRFFALIYPRMSSSLEDALRLRGGDDVLALVSAA